MSVRVMVVCGLVVWSAGLASATVVFSNIGPPPSPVIQLLFQASDDNWAGTRVTTDNQYWKLNSLTIPLFNPQNAGTPFPAQAFTYQAHIYADSTTPGLPGSQLLTVNGDFGVADGAMSNVMFTHTGPTFVFQPNTTYWVVASQVEDTNPAPGSGVLADYVTPTGVWTSPLDVAQSTTAGAGWVVGHASDRMQFEIDAMLVPEPAAAMVLSGVVLLRRRRRVA